MSRFHSYLHSAVAILDAYQGQEPFAGYLKKYFAQHKKYGSRDRKSIAHLCYCYFRLGKAAPELPRQDRLLKALFLCSEQPHELLAELQTDWNAKTVLPLREKMEFVEMTQLGDLIFPWKDKLSEGMEPEAFNLSHLQQPDLYLRLRPGQEAVVRKKLKQAGIGFSEVNSHSLSLPNASKVDSVIEMDKEAVVQDLSSQETGEWLRLVRPADNEPLTVWDCCAASGGKSIMAHDLAGPVELFVSDVRESILVNLDRRFERAGLTGYKMFVADLSKPPEVFLPTFNLVIADVPCTGSGTWGRTPEQLYFFDPRKVDSYAALQRKILQSVTPQVERGGYLLYITCSVFSNENEEQIAWLQEKFHLQLMKMELLKGYHKKADTLFAALLQKPL